VGCGNRNRWTLTFFITSPAVTELARVTALL
jgi:hypothetical protein